MFFFTFWQYKKIKIIADVYNKCEFKRTCNNECLLYILMSFHIVHKTMVPHLKPFLNNFLCLVKHFLIIFYIKTLKDIIIHFDSPVISETVVKIWHK